MVPIALTAQSAPAAKGMPAGDDPSKWDIFLGYSALIPNATITTANAHAYGYQSIDYGAIVSITRYFNRNIGLQFEGDEHILLPEQSKSTTSQPGDDFSGGEAGLAFRFPMANVYAIPAWPGWHRAGRQLLAEGCFWLCVHRRRRFGRGDAGV